jgi:DNA repair protein RecN (Recombination protein N)
LLTRLHIRNLAVVEDVALEFDSGLNVLTGSTGAGKSLILGAVNLLLGGRASPNVIRAGEDRAEVEAVFESSSAEYYSARSEQSSAEYHSARRKQPGAAGGRLTVRREIRRNGRSYAYVDGAAVGVKQLQEVCVAWIEPHGQNDQLRLRDPETHAGYVDVFAGNAALLAQYGEDLGVYRRAEGDLAEFDRRIAALKEKEELLRHRIEEIDRAAVAEGELDDLESTIRRMENSERIFEALAFVQKALDEDESGADVSLAQSIKQLERVADMDERLAAFASQLEEASVVVRDCADGVRAYVEDFQFDPDKLRTMQERRAYLLELERRYGMSADELVRARDEWTRELDTVAFEDEERKKLSDRRDEVLESVQMSAGRLSASRKSAARKLDKQMTRELDGLMIAGAGFRTDFGIEEDVGGPLVSGRVRVAARPDGADVVRFMARTNPGESEGAVDEIASTGEISRISLALKSAVQKAGKEGRQQSVLIFDELDAGVGADLGGVIAEKLLELSASYQIICITHMPQIAAAGKRHLVVAKKSERGRTFAQVEKVDGGDRRREIARMLGGEDGSGKRLDLAGELLSSRSGIESKKMRP